MNNLEKTILDQHARIRSAGDNPVDALEEAKGEILEVANQDNVSEILKRNFINSIYLEMPSSTTAQLRRIRHDEYLAHIANTSLEWLRNLVASDVIAPMQGYLGGIALEGGRAIGVFGFPPGGNWIYARKGYR
ncbi:MAG: hypothetical protein H6799_00620 [Candidatus Nomurabacteria bacterium]|nr:MAG: hypothetical protein H6799_00620 [Candidatus Nomurabacteria bacterium]HRV76260.1 hypothetical protein [Candidatus Saccharimonadales bacterium]